MCANTSCEYLKMPYVEKFVNERKAKKTAMCDHDGEKRRLLKMITPSTV